MKTNATGLLLTWLSSVFAPTQKQHKSVRRGKINTGTTRIKRYFPVVGRQVSFGRAQSIPSRDSSMRTVMPGA
jgi:hypothetical protein